MEEEKLSHALEDWSENNSIDSADTSANGRESRIVDITDQFAGKSHMLTGAKKP